MGRPPLDLRGESFGRLSPQRRLSNGSWWCHCECGNWTEVTVGNLRSGRVRSCGCLRRENAAEVGKARANEPAPMPESGLRKWRKQKPEAQRRVLDALRKIAEMSKQADRSALEAAILLLWQSRRRDKK